MTLRRSTRLVLLSLLALTLFACGGRSRNRRPDARGIGYLPPSPGPAQAFAGPLGAGNGLAMPCGNQTCNSGTQTCCSSGDMHVCQPNVPPGPGDATQLLGSQIQACQAALSMSVDHLARCQSSSQCGGQQICCDNFLFGGASVNLCRDGGPQSVCEYGEVCTLESPCRTPGSVCARGKCVKRAPIQCGATPCDPWRQSCVRPIVNGMAAQPVCITHEQLAADRRAGRPSISVRCVSHADCLPGERCHATMMGETSCSVADGGGNLATVCNVDADCPASVCWVPGQRPRCGADAGLWHKTCVCR